MKYRKEIEGLRALAVLGVVLFHFDFFSATGGFFGVDVFFVISGYLISSILFAEVDATGTLSLSQFYLRRARRILPALFTFLFFSYVLFALIIKNPQSPFPHYGDSLLTAIFSVSNIFFWLNAGYFALDAWAEPLLHTWSLGVEEQFYFVIPLLLLLLAKFRNNNKDTGYWLSFLSIAFVSFAFCRWGGDLVDRDFIFYMLPSRMWELLLGVLVALTLRKYDLLNSKQLLLCNILGCIGVGLMVYGFFFYHETTRFAEKALVITGGSALFILFANKRTWVGKLFSTPPFRFIGKISYSWYLWHWPLVSLSVMLPLLVPSVPETVISISTCAISLVLAYFSWKYVETPFRQKKEWKECTLPLAPVFLVLLAIGVGNSLNLFGASPFTFEQRFTRGYSLKNPGKPHDGALGSPSQPLSFALIGNSHAQAVAPAISRIAKEKNIRGVFIWDGIMPFLNMRRKDQDAFKSDMKKELISYIEAHNIKHVLIVARYDQIWESFQSILYKEKALNKDDINKIFYTEIKSLITSLTTHCKEVWIMEQVPIAHVDPTIALRLDPTYSEPFTQELHNDMVRNVVKDLDNPNIHIINPRSFFVKNGRKIFNNGTNLLYFDRDHLSLEGANTIQKIFIPFLQQTANSRIKE